MTKKSACRRKCAAMLAAGFMVWAAPAVAADEAYPNGAMGGYEAKFIDAGGIRTRYYEVGEGAPLVLVHGSGFSGTANANTWIPVLPGFAKNFHVYAPDKLASGMTGNPESDDDLNIGGEVRHMYEFVTALGLERFHLIGQSRGGGLVFLFTVDHPEMVRTLVIVDSSTATPPAGDDRGHRRERLMGHCSQDTWLDRWPCQYRALSYNTDHVTEDFAASSLYMAGLPKSLATEARMTPEMRKRNSVVTSRMNHDAYHRILTESVLQMPVLLYWAKNDPSVLPAQAYSFFNILAETNPLARLFFTNRGGHFHYREMPDEFVHNVSSFIEFWSGRE